MANRNTIRTFQTEAIYHVYNRGVARQPIFLDEQDYQAFMRRLKLMFSPPEQAEKLQHMQNRIRINSSYNQVWLQAFCLMPNHFHMMLKQGANENAITSMMRTLATSYSMYFNAKYDRVGSVFQGRFKAAHVDNYTYLLHLSRYIHCNPIALKADIYTYPFSSLQYYYIRNKPEWLAPDEVEQLFSSQTEYYAFVNDLKDLKSVSELYDL